jgi:hypothetical protein
MGFLEAGRHGGAQFRAQGLSHGLRDSSGAPYVGSMASALVALGAFGVALVAGCGAGLVAKWHPDVVAGVPEPVRAVALSSLLSLSGSLCA